MWESSNLAIRVEFASPKPGQTEIAADPEGATYEVSSLKIDCADIVAVHYSH